MSDPTASISVAAHIPLRGLLVSIFMLVHSVRSTLLNVFSQMLRMMSADLWDVCRVLSVGCYSQHDFSVWPSGLGYSLPLGLGPQNISFYTVKNVYNLAAGTKF